PPSMAKLQWAKLTKFIRPRVTDNPTDGERAASHRPDRRTERRRRKRSRRAPQTGACAGAPHLRAIRGPLEPGLQKRQDLGPGIGAEATGIERIGEPEISRAGNHDSACDDVRLLARRQKRGGLGRWVRDIVVGAVHE